MAKNKPRSPKFNFQGIPTQESQEFFQRVEDSNRKATRNIHNLLDNVDVRLIDHTSDICLESSKSKAGSPAVKKQKGDVVSKPITSAIKTIEAVDPSIVTTKIVADDDTWIPEYKTDGAACVDLKANIPPDVHGNREINLPYRVGQLIDCGISIELPPGFKAEIAARSGWANRGLVVANSPGQVDEDYRGRICVAVYNVGKEILKIKHGDRIAQMWPVPVYRFQWDRVDQLEETNRGTGGFGSTGV
jgi:dUTP pyrophosphatase